MAKKRFSIFTAVASAFAALGALFITRSASAANDDTVSEPSRTAGRATSKASSRALLTAHASATGPPHAPPIISAARPGEAEDEPHLLSCLLSAESETLPPPEGLRVGG